MFVHISVHELLLMARRRPFHFEIVHQSEKLDDASNCQSHAVSILPISNVQCCGATLHFAREEWEVHTPPDYKREKPLPVASVCLAYSEDCMVGSCICHMSIQIEASAVFRQLSTHLVLLQEIGIQVEQIRALADIGRCSQYHSALVVRSKPQGNVVRVRDREAARSRLVEAMVMLDQAFAGTGYVS